MCLGDKGSLGMSGRNAKGMSIDEKVSGVGGKAKKATSSPGS